MDYSVVWFKRDLRLHDHAALHAAAARGPLLCLYVVEPALWREPDAARQHYEFILESLRELYRALLEHCDRLSPLQAYTMRNLMGAASNPASDGTAESIGYPPMPPEATRGSLSIPPTSSQRLSV